MNLVYDYDYMKYSIGSACESRTIQVVHKQSGNTKEFKTRTEFYGHHLKKEGGWLGDQNKGREEPWTVDDFDITDVQRPEPVSFAIQTVKNHIKNINEKLGATGYYGYIGKGDSWRVEASTILKYKGQRSGNLRPLLMEDIEHYLLTYHAGEIVTDLEADDQVVIDATADEDLCIIGVDKDYYGCAVRYYNIDKMTEPLLIRGLGELYLDEKGKVRGHGRKFFYFQVLASDSSDNYFANSATTKKWGEKSAYKLLADCTTDADCWRAMVSGYKGLYPSATTITGWRGDQFEINWMYVLNENCQMAHMLRKADEDRFDVKKVLDNLKIEY